MSTVESALLAAPMRRARADSRAGWALQAVAWAAVLTGVGLALLWLRRHPVITGWDYLSHVDSSLSDAALARAHDLGALRDQLFLLDRFEPPGLRLLGLPVAALFGPDALAALRLTAVGSFVLTAALLWLGLRRLAGGAGAAAAVAAFALAPLNVVGAQNFMTEEVLLPCAAAALWLLAAEARDEARTVSAGQFARWCGLGLALGWGTLTKLTFLPSLGIVWLGVAGYLWLRGRDTAGLLLRLAVPGAALLLVAWPHYVVNGARYLAYARATAAGFGFGFAQFPEHGMAFAQRVGEVLLGDVFGVAGLVTLLAGWLLLAVSWRAARAPARLMAVLCVAASLPMLSAFLLSYNQTDRYLAPAVLLLTVPAAIGFGAAVRSASAFAGAAAGVAAAVGLAQIAASWALAFGAPLDLSVLSGLRTATVRPDFACDYRTLARLTAPRDGPVRVALFGETQAVNPYDVNLGYLRAGVPAQVMQFSDSSSGGIDWDSVLGEAPQVDYVVQPDVVDGWYAGLAVNRSRAEFRDRLAALAQVTQWPGFTTGPDAECHVTVLEVRPRADAPPPRRPPLRPVTYIPGWTVTR